MKKTRAPHRHITHHVLSAAGAQHLVTAVLHYGQLPRIVHNTDTLILKEELLTTVRLPRDLTELAGLEVAHEQRLRGAGNQVP